jgi:hypothetical protein
MKEHTTQPTMAIEDNLGTNSKLRFKTHTAGEEIVKDWLKGNGAIRVDSCPGFDMAAFFDDGSMEVIKVETVVQYLAPHFKLSEKASSQLLGLYRQHEDVMLCPLLSNSHIKYRAYFVGLQTPYAGAVLFSCDLKDVEALLADGCNQHMIDTNNLAYVHHHAVQLRQKNFAKAYLDIHFSHPPYPLDSGD